MLIGLTGLKGSGKDTVGDYLVEKYDFNKIAFGTKIKESASLIWGIDPGIWDRKLKHDDFDSQVLITYRQYLVATVTGRQFLQNFGESMKQVLGVDIWTRATLQELQLTKNTVITDIRYDIEAEEISALGGVIFEIVRFHENDDPHSSESGISTVWLDGTIYNDTSFENLYKAVDSILIARLTGVGS